MMPPLALAPILLVLALGAFSSLLFVWQWTIGAPSHFVAVLLFIAVCGSAVALLVHLARTTEPRPVGVGLPLILLIAALVFGAYWTAGPARAFPHGSVDAWAIWNVHARFLFRGSAGGWQNMFVPAEMQGHPDYPLLVPD